MKNEDITLEWAFENPTRFIDAPSWVVRVIMAFGFLELMALLWADWFVSLPFAVAVVSGGSALYRWSLRDALSARLLDYGQRFENVYITSESESDRSERERADMARVLLRLSGNRTQLAVVLIVYQAGEHVNETWDQYEARVKHTIEEDRKTRHAWGHDAFNDQYFDLVMGRKKLTIV